MDRWGAGGVAGVQMAEKIYRLGANIKIIFSCGFRCGHDAETEQTFQRWRLEIRRRLYANLAFFFSSFGCFRALMENWN